MIIIKFIINKLNSRNKILNYRNVYRLWYVSREYEGELDN